MIYRPAKTLGLISGLVIGLTIAIVSALLLGILTSQPLGFSLLLSVLLLVASLVALSIWAYWFYCLISLRYDLDRNRLVIHSAGMRFTIPMGSILHMVRGADLTPSGDLRGISWPGYYRGRIETAEQGAVLVHCTAPLDQQLVLVTESACYGLSPSRPERFAEDLRTRQALGAIRALSPSQERTGVAAWPVWRDRLYWALCLLAALANAALLAVVLSRFRAVDAQVLLPSSGPNQLSRIASGNWALLIPGIGALSWIVNTLLGLTLYRHEKPAAFLLVSGALGIQIVVWAVAVIAWR